MSDMLSQSQLFMQARQEEARLAAQLVAFRLATGVDLDAALRAGPAERTRILARLERLIERERQRGCRRHWAYDLNRHIALAQAAVRLRAAAGKERPEREPPAAGRRRASGIRRS